MRSVSQRLVMYRCSLVLCLCWLLLCPHSVGQDIGPEKVTDEDVRATGDFGIGVPLENYLPSPRRLAFSLLRHFELVANGEFLDIEATPQELRALKREDAIVRFRIHKLYKGPAKDAVNIRLTRDMLVFPGEDISRYLKREQILDQQEKDLKPIREHLDALSETYEAGVIDRREYETESSRLESMVRKRIDRDGLASGRVFSFISHGTTFYERDGAIRVGQKYLIGVNRIPDSGRVYALDSVFSDSRIYWGEMRDYILPGFDDPELQNQPH